MSELVIIRNNNYIKTKLFLKIHSSKAIYMDLLTSFNPTAPIMANASFSSSSVADCLKISQHCFCPSTLVSWINILINISRKEKY